MTPDILVFTDVLRTARDVLMVDHDAERFDDRANWMKLPDGKIVEVRPISARLYGMIILDPMVAHVWVFRMGHLLPIEHSNFIESLKTRFGPPGFRGRLHQNTGLL